jgi:hypothetical protein
MENCDQDIFQASLDLPEIFKAAGAEERIGIGERNNSEVLISAGTIARFAPDDIAGLYVNLLSLLATEQHECFAAIDTEHFMGDAVIMLKGKNSIPPRIAPVV